MGAPSGLAPVAFAPSALARRVTCRSFYFDLALLEDYWLRRKYHHTISASLVYALHEALAAIEEEGLEARWQRHERHHLALAAGLEAMGLGLLPPPGERLWTLNAVRVPDGVDEARARRDLLARFNMEVGAGLGPLAGKIWRVGLMGAGSTPQTVLLVPRRARGGASLAGVPRAARRRHGRRHRGAGVRARTASRVSRGRRRPGVGQVVLALLGAVFGYLGYVYLTLPDVAPLRPTNPTTTAFIELRAARGPRQGAPGRGASSGGCPTAGSRRRSSGRCWSPRTRRSGSTRGSTSSRSGSRSSATSSRARFSRGGSTITQQLAKNLYLSPSKNPLRKLRELLIARRLEAELSKTRILEIYLNVIEWGDGIYGAEAAARELLRQAGLALLGRGGGAARGLHRQPARA